MSRNHSLIGSIGAHESWSRTVDRTKRTAPARSKSPSSIEYWVLKLDPERFENATGEQRVAAADAMRKAYFLRLAMASAKARSKASARDVAC